MVMIRPLNVLHVSTIWPDIWSFIAMETISHQSPLKMLFSTMLLPPSFTFHFGFLPHGHFAGLGHGNEPS